MILTTAEYSTMNFSSLPPVASANAPDADIPFDVRPIPCRIKHGLIFQRWLDLPVGGHFVLLNDHDPVPLRYQFEAEFPGALSWEYLERGPEDFRVKITKLQATTGAKSIPAGCAPPSVVSASVVDSGVAEVDARGLEPPEPLVRILNALESLPAGATLHARTDREPCHLFGEATQRGFRHESKAQPDGSWFTVLTRA
jgi:uncharacterized protein (DUF2249 family)